MKKFLIIHADDFGLSTGTNLGIIKAYKNGILTSTSLLATTPGFEMAVKLAKACPDLGVGVHLSLTSGKSVLNSNLVHKLVNQNGQFYPSFVRLLLKARTDRQFLYQIKSELNAQINKVITTGIKIDHINSERHVHMIPNIYPLVFELAQKNKIKYLRIPKENFHLVPSLPELINPFVDTNLLKFLLMRLFSINKKSAGIKFFGIIYTTKTNSKVLKHTISLVKPGITEILLHPAKFKITKKEEFWLDFEKQKMLYFMKDKNRLAELSALTNKSIKKFILENNIVLTNYKKLS